MAVNLLANFADPGGVGRHARNFAAALSRRIDLVPLPIFPTAHFAPEDAELPPRRMWDMGGTGICLSAAAGLRLPPGRRRIFYTVCETSRIPAELADLLRQCDEVWVPSAWCRDAMLAGGMDAQVIRIVPEGVDCDRFRPAAEPAPRPRFRFLSIGKWEERKGLPLLVRAFRRTFGPQEPVELILHAANPYRLRADPAQQLQALLAAHPGPEVSFSPPRSLSDLVALMQSSDAFVLPTRGEGWGLPILEAMACGLPCIVTGHGGHLDFAAPDTVRLIDVRAMVPVDDPCFFDPRHDWGCWAEPDEDHLCALLREVFENRQVSKALGLAACEAALSWPWDRGAAVAQALLA